MLENLHVKNFALIDESELSFGKGLNVLTGETGAGKSILIDAVSSALGARTGAEYIRKGADSAYVELVFSVEPDKKPLLEALEVSTEYDCIVLSRRILPTRSVHKINDETVTSAKIRAVTELLLDIHGQHEHQSLLKTSRQLEILDEFAGEELLALRSRVGEQYRLYSRAKTALAGFTLSEEERLRRVDFLEYELSELDSAQILPGERGELTDRFRKMQHFEKIERALQQMLSALGDEAGGAGDSVARAGRELAQAARFAPELEELEQELRTIEDLMSTVSREAEGFLADSRFDPAEFKTIEDRLDTIHRLESKYGDLSESFDAIRGERQKQLDELTDYEKNRKRTEEELASAGEALERLCAELSERRREAAAELSARIETALQELNFLSVDFSVAFTTAGAYSAHGTDEIEFMISLNPGQDPAPLAKVASGGELSRIMLAIKTILADRDDIPTVIFDEIDTGISGRTAQLVGRKLREIAKYRQVILITHLPQIAALAEQHMEIEKYSQGNQTFTRVRRLDEAGSVRELARLLGGMDLTEEVLRTAADMKRRAAELY